MKGNTAARLRRRGQLAEIGYWGIIVPCLLLLWLVRGAAELISETWPAWALVALIGAVLLGFSLVVSSATDAAQRLMGAWLLAAGSAALTAFFGAIGE